MGNTNKQPDEYIKVQMDLGANGRIGYAAENSKSANLLIELNTKLLQKVEKLEAKLDTHIKETMGNIHKDIEKQYGNRGH